MSELLNKENLPKEITSQVEFIEKFIDQYKIDMGDLEGVHHIFCWKINVKGLEPQKVADYLMAIEAGVSEPLEKLGCACFYVPVQEELTSLSIVDLRTMKYVTI